MRPVTVRSGALPTGERWAELVAAGEPILFKGAASNWPLVQAGITGPVNAAAIVRAGYSGQPVVVFRGEAAIRGRFFYNDAVNAFNFTAAREPLGPVLDELLAMREMPDAPALYIGSTDIPTVFSGLDPANGLDLAAIHPMLVENPGLSTMWIGNRTTASCHYDATHNIAVCAVGRRRFTLFPPDQVGNLYPGPLEPTPGGQVVSMVDVATPDLIRYPRFADALAAGQVAEMEPGDVLVYPALWWHHVEALTGFNILVNYWWSRVPGFIDTPQSTLLHAMLSLRDRPATEKAGWKALFDYYVFGDPAVPREHLPAHAQGPLAPIDDSTARRLRATVTRKLQR